MKLYLVIRASMVFGIFSSKKLMKMAIESYIKNEYEIHGSHGNYHFRYIVLKPNDPWFTENDSDRTDVAKALFSLSTMHDEYYINKIETDWSTGEITKI